MAESKKKNSLAGTIVFVILLAVVLLGVYLSITRNKKDGKLEADVQIPEIRNLLDRNLDNDYPPTAREVMKLYCRMTQCLYNDDLSDKEIESLVDQIRKLYASDLLAENDRDSMISLVRGEVMHYRSNEMKINSYSVEESAEIEYNRVVKPQKAVIDIYFTIKREKGFERAYEEFVLVEEEKGSWKILGWRLSEE